MNWCGFAGSDMPHEWVEGNDGNFVCNRCPYGWKHREPRKSEPESYVAIVPGRVEK